MASIELFWAVLTNILLVQLIFLYSSKTNACLLPELCMKIDKDTNKQKIDINYMHSMYIDNCIAILGYDNPVGYDNFQQCCCFWQLENSTQSQDAYSYHNCKQYSRIDLEEPIGYLMLDTSHDHHHDVQELTSPIVDEYFQQRKDYLFCLDYANIGPVKKFTEFGCDKLFGNITVVTKT